MRISDWSSDVCSSDLRLTRQIDDQAGGEAGQQHGGGSIALGVNKEARADRGIDRQGKGREPEQEPDEIEGGYAAQDDHQSHKRPRSEEHTSELQPLMRISYAVFCLKKKKTTTVQQKC